MNDFCCLKTGSGLTLEGTLRLTLEGRRGGGGGSVARFHYCGFFRGKKWKAAKYQIEIKKEV